MAKTRKASRGTVSSAKQSLEIPADFQSALNKNAAAKNAFAAFSPSHQREYLKWILEAKRDETRTMRIASTVEKLASAQ
jgi:uncharacterized protein YdeI (YjbR/CyaY-like superfamily)